MKWLALTALILLFSVSFAYYLYFSRKADCLVLDKRRTIEVNGVPVRGEVLEGRGISIVPRRDAGKEHSYELLFAGDVDPTGDMGSAADCNRWIPPNLPLLIATRQYPSCTENGPEGKTWRLMSRGGLHFTTADNTIIQIN
jgi:hypothetical protein